MITGLPPTPLISGAGGVFAAIGSSLSFSQTATGVTITPSAGAAITIPAATDSLAGMLDAARATIIDNLAAVASSGKYSDLVSPPDRHAIISMIFDGGGSAIVAPIIRYLQIPFAATLTGWVLLADQSGSITIDLWKAPIASYPPVVGNSITGGVPMTLTSQTNNAALTIPAGWTTALINAGDVLAFDVSAAATCHTVTAQLILTH